MTEGPRKPVPPEFHSENPDFFRNYYVIPSKGPFKQTGVFELGVESGALSEWRRNLRVCVLKHPPGGQYASTTPALETQAEEFTVKKRGEGGVSVQLRGLKGLTIPVTMVLKQNSARIYHPLGPLGTTEDPKTVIEQLGPEYWTTLPGIVKDYHEQNPAPRPSRTEYRRGKRSEADEEIKGRLRELSEQWFGGEKPDPERLLKAYLRAFPEKLSPSKLEHLSKIIHRL